jgi:transposase-like protein
MTYQHDCTLPEEFLEQIAREGLDVIPDLIRIIVNQAMEYERQQHLGAGRYQRTARRQGYANGYKPKTVKTRQGKITFDIPQVREGNFYPSALEKGERSERALKLTFAEMYVQGVSTRKVSAVIEKLCGMEVSSSQVSRATAQLDEVLSAWRERPIGEIIYLYLDARYEKVRIAGQLRDAAILLASGVSPDGKRQILGVSVSLSEAEVHWRAFLKHLLSRELCGVLLIISDDHLGLKAARKAVFGSTPWQRCQFHMQKNAQAYIPRVSMRTEVAADIRQVFNAPDKATAQLYLHSKIEKYAEIAPALADWLEDNLPEGLACFDFPRPHRRRIRTDNMLERTSQEVKRRTQVVRIFPNEASCLRLVSAVLMEISERWETSRVYLTFDEVMSSSSP